MSRPFTYGDINQPFYNSMVGMYERTVKLITGQKAQNMFQERCRKIVEDTYGIGWGFHDNLSDIYCKYFETYSRPPVKGTGKAQKSGK